MPNTKIVDISVPEYITGSMPDNRIVGAKLDKLLIDNFNGRDVVLRCIGSNDHPSKTLDDLVGIILATGTDKYDPTKPGVGYEVGHTQGKKIDFFGTKVSVCSHTDIFTVELPDDFYHGAQGDRGLAVRIDIIMVYDLGKITQVEHLYGEDVEESDGFVFKEPESKREALVGVIKILS